MLAKCYKHLLVFISTFFLFGVVGVAQAPNLETEGTASGETVEPSDLKPVSWDASQGLKMGESEKSRQEAPTTRLAQPASRAVPASSGVKSSPDFPRGEAWAGYNLLSGKRLSSVQSSVLSNRITGHGLEFGATGNLASWVGVDGQVNLFFTGSSSNIERVRTYTYNFGPRLSYRTRQGTLWGRVLLGATTTHATAFIPRAYYPLPILVRVNETDFSILWGGGLDANINKRAALRLGLSDLVVFPKTGSVGAQHNIVFDVGIVFKFGY
jgi:hypothetical protein